MADGRDEVGAVRDWLRDHGVVVPDGADPVGGCSGAARGADDHRQGEAGHDLTPGGWSATVGGTADEPADGGSRRRPTGRSGRGGGRDGRRTDGSRRRRGDVGDRDGDHVGGRAGERDDGVGSDGPDGPDADPEQMARTIVLRKLTAQSRTRAELERALRSKAVPEEAAEAVLDRMGEVGLVDDAAFARDWVASRQQRRHLSRTALRRELQTKGVDREVIDEALADVGGDDEHRAALDLARRRAAPMAGLAREVAHRRLGGVLARRGFSASVTARVLSEVLDATDED